jgi:hypothetical protein
MKLTVATLILIMMISGAQAAISGATVVTGVHNSDRVVLSTNTSYNISYTESVMTQSVNISFPAGFSAASFALTDMTNNTGNATSVIVNGRWINVSYTAKAAGLIYFAITANVKSNATAGDYHINISSNYTNLSATAPTSIPLYVRDSTKPYYVVANNSVFTVASETITTGQTIIALTGTGVSNLTFHVPNITTQTNITIGWSAGSNVTRLRAFNGTDSDFTVYLDTDGTVTNPIITLKASTEWQSTNLPYGLAIVGVSAVLIIIYRLKKKRNV